GGEAGGRDAAAELVVRIADRLDFPSPPTSAGSSTGTLAGPRSGLRRQPGADAERPAGQVGTRPVLVDAAAEGCRGFTCRPCVDVDEGARKCSTFRRTSDSAGRGWRIRRPEGSTRLGGASRGLPPLRRSVWGRAPERATLDPPRHDAGRNPVGYRCAAGPAGALRRGHVP